MPNPQETQLRPTVVTRHVVLEKCDYFLDVQLWPLKTYINPEAWLDNFASGEQGHALCLLHAFQYFSHQLVDELFRAAIQNLSLVVCSPTDPFIAAQTKWHNFLAQAVFTYVEGETPNPADSGFAFVRRARNLIGVDETTQILTIEQAITELLQSRSRTPVIFVDDFVGSGDQFVKSWHRKRTLTSGVSTSFAEVASTAGGHYFYCPLVSTDTGVERIRLKCPEVRVFPVHTLTNRDSVLAPDSYVWPAHLQPTSLNFLEQTSIRAGIPHWKGYADLGLTIAFAHSVPDATLPLFYWDQNGRTPLVPDGRQT